MKNLVIDIGNSRTKAAILREDAITVRTTFPDADAERIMVFAGEHPDIDRCIVSSTAQGILPLEKSLKALIPTVVRMGPELKTPLKNLYRSPETLGSDRLAAAVGANMLFPGENLLVADMGTALTMDAVTVAGEYLGGSISPGVRMRFEALHEKTGRLPMGCPEDAVDGIAGTTAEAVANGVMNGIAYELEGYRQSLEQKMGKVRVILTGGDADYFVKRLKNTIFANYDLVILGLNRILNYNVPEQENL